MFSYIVRNMYNTIVPSTLESFDGYNTSTRSHYSLLTALTEYRRPSHQKSHFFLLKKLTSTPTCNIGRQAYTSTPSTSSIGLSVYYYY